MSQLIWSGSTPFTSAGAGEEETVTLRVPHRGELRGYSLVAADGGATGNFTAALYTSKRDTAPNSALPADAFKILSFTQTTPSATDSAVAYLNRDGTPTNPQRNLYLKITRSGGSKALVFTVTIDTPRVG